VTRHRCWYAEYDVIRIAFISLALALFALAQVKSTKPKSAPPKTAAKKSTPTKSAATKNSSSKKTPSKSRTSRRAPRRVTQAEPSPDRYREIQQALKDRGHLQKEPDGKWDAESIAALNKFKKEQSLSADGKIDSRSLIGLGLGPKRTAQAVVPQPSASPANP
jgi:hypothetical protein